MSVNQRLWSGVAARSLRRLACPEWSGRCCHHNFSSPGIPAHPQQQPSDKHSDMDRQISVRELPSRNPEPSTAKAHHIGSPPTSFKNPWPSFREHSKLDVLKLRFGSNAEKNFVPVPEGPDGTRSERLVKVLKPDWGFEQEDRLRATWIGHASWLVETPRQNGAKRGVRILLDPVFSERTSPFSFAGPKRYTPTPCSLDELPDPDVVCISHNHYDHLVRATSMQS